MTDHKSFKRQVRERMTKTGESYTAALRHLRANPRVVAAPDVPRQRHGREILDGLLEPGRALAFVDESGTPGKPLPGLAGDFYFMSAVVFPSSAYPAIKDRLRRALPAGVREFHTKEIVNPDSRSPWKTVPVAERLAALRLLAEVLHEHATEILFCYVSGEQYYSEILPKIVEAGGPSKGHKDALEWVFLKSLLPRLRQPEREVAVIFDSKVAAPDTIRVQELVDPTGYYEGAVISVESWVEEGLQLADFAAYAANRLYHSKQRNQDGRANEFDVALAVAFNDLHPRYKNLLDGQA